MDKRETDEPVHAISSKCTPNAASSPATQTGSSARTGDNGRDTIGWLTNGIPCDLDTTLTDSPNTKPVMR